MGLLGKLFGRSDDGHVAMPGVGEALRAAGHDATRDTWSGWVFTDAGRPVAIKIGDGEWVDLTMEQRPDAVGRGPDAPIIWNEEPGVSREVFVDDGGAPSRDHLLGLVIPALTPVVEAGAFSMRIERAMVNAVFPAPEPIDPAALTRRLLDVLPVLHRAMGDLETAYASWTNVVEP